MSDIPEEGQFQEEGFEDGFEERADHVDEQVIRDGTATGDHSDEVVKHLLARGLVLLVGPRGCGKTHLMRYAWLSAISDKSKPFCVYTSLNRYLSLEPWSRTRTDVTALFHSWTLARILEAAQDAFNRAAGLTFDVAGALGLDDVDLGKLVNTLERNFELDLEDEQLHRSLSVDVVSGILRSMASKAERRRIVVLLDDAALTLSSTFMSEFLDIIRVLKATDIAPKCSIYPGTTVFGQRFHADHEGRTVSAWVPVTDPSYRTMMQTIAERRYPDGLQGLTDDANGLLQYAAFGIPRAYLTLMRAVKTEKPGSLQATLTKVIREHKDNRISEYRSLGDKAVELRTLVRAGETLFESVVEGVKEANDKLSDKKTKQALVGIQDEEFDPLSERMMDLLTEAGLLFRETAVSHGPERQYRRFSPHLAALIAARAFSGGARGNSATAIVEFIERPAEKHPVRRNLKKLLETKGVADLKLDLPPCQACNTPRETDKQRFCQHCGTRLADELIYNRIMALDVTKVPALSSFLISKLRTSNFRTVGDIRAVRDPGSELRKLKDIGEARSNKILAKVESYVDEMMS
ncbi:ATP-binding protein [Rhizobium leguminosarum]|nr:ATP-binding protein [Rhizobium leguminosarum]